MKRIIFILLFLLCIQYIRGQYSTLGTDFWVAFKQNFNTPTNCILYITSGVGATGTVSMPGTGWSQNFTIAPNGSASIQIPDAQGPCVTTPNTVLNKGIRIVSNNPIAVYAANQRTASSDATLVLPVTALGDEYVISSYSVLSGQPSQFIIVGVANNTSIQIIPKAAVIGGVAANVPFNITLNAGQVYLVQSNGDLTGSIVRATNLNNCENFAVFAGNRCANVPTTCYYCDHLYEQMIPLKAWGTKYATAPLMTRDGDQFRIVAMENGTTVSINGGAGINLNAGQFHEVYLNQASFITSTKPVSVAQYSRGTTCDNVTSDPFMIILSPVEQFINHIVFQAFNTTAINQFYTNIITKTANTSLATLDGAAIPGWAPIPSNPSYSFARRNVTQGSHTLHSDSGLVAIVYGFGNVESYGYLAGANVLPLNVSFSIIVNNDTIPYNQFTDTLGCNQNTVSFITDPNSQINNISWNFGDGTTGVNSPVTHTFPGSGTYTVTMYYQRNGSCVLDSLQMQVVINSNLPPINLPNDTVFCNPNDILIIDATTQGATSYFWSNSSTNPIIIVNSPGTYSVTVSDSFNCSATGSVTVDYVNLTLTTTQTNVSCLGMNDGTAQVTASGGVQPYTYLWDTQPLSNTQNISNLSAGTYTVTVTEQNGCTATASVTITQTGLLNINPSQTNVSCFGYADGIASVAVTGGSPPYTYSWSTTPVQTTSSASGLAAGTYTVTITDNLGCSATHTFSITEPTELFADIPIVSPAACSGTPGQMTASGSGGTPPYTFVWNTNPPQYSMIANGLQPGIYTVTITDNQGCTATASAEYTVIGLSITQTPENCNQSNGSATVNVTDYTGSYSILWSNGSTSQTISNLPAGQYTVTVTDDNGSCIATITVNEIQGPIANFTMNPNPAIVGEDYVHFYNNSSGGNSWFWNFGDNNTSTSENPIHIYTNSGTYTVWLYVSDANNCIDSVARTIIIQDIFTIYVPNAFSPNNDGINDVFMPFGLNLQPDHYRMSIFNRWGQLIFQTTNINIPWDGRTLQGDKMITKTDVYTYLIEYRDNKGNDKSIRGIVTIVF